MKFVDKEKNRIKTSYGPWALITGASSGIGKELSYRIAEAGLNVVIAARSLDKLNRIKEDLEQQYGVEVMVVQADLSESQEVHKLIDAIQQVDIGLLVASAGFGTSGSFLDTSMHAEVNMLRVNCEALLMLTHHFSQVFSRKKKGGMILMSSIVAFQGVPFAANYAATKAYVQTLAEALAVELKPVGVDILAAAPGPVQSGFGERANMNMDMSLSPEQVGVPILKALGRKSMVLPGSLTKFLVYAIRTAPRWGKIRIMKQVMGGMTKHQRTAAG